VLIVDTTMCAYHETQMRYRSGLIVAVGAALILIPCLWWFYAHRQSAKPNTTIGSARAVSSAKPGSNQPHLNQTRIHAHNVLLRKGPNFRVYVRWLDGQLARTHRDANPSLDDPDSFYLDIYTGVLRANIGDIGGFLNTSLSDSPLQHVTLSAAGDLLKLTGTVRKIVPLSFQLIGEVSATPDNRIRVHVTKLDILKVPLKGLLGIFKVSLADLFKQRIDGVEISGNDVFIDAQKVVPPPHIRGKLTKVHVVSPDIEEVYGNAAEDVQRVELWRNFLSLKGGAITFGKLTMNSVDLIMIDISKDPWFDLDLVNYQAQLTSGYTRVTPESGLQIFMPDFREIQPAKATVDTSIEWFKNRNIPPPPQITAAFH
jgi:hypothetical protein